MFKRAGPGEVATTYLGLVSGSLGSLGSLALLLLELLLQLLRLLFRLFRRLFRLLFAVGRVDGLKQG